MTLQGGASGGGASGGGASGSGASGGGARGDGGHGGGREGDCGDLSVRTELVWRISSSHGLRLPSGPARTMNH